MSNLPRIIALNRLNLLSNLVGRTVIGLAFGFLFGMAGMFLGWFVYLFAVPRSSITMLTILITSGGVGAAAGTVVSWVSLRHNRPRSLVLGFVLSATTGIGGAFSAYLYIASQGELLIEIDRLAVMYRPDINPTLVMVAGATVAANAAALLLAVRRGLADAKRVEPFRF